MIERVARAICRTTFEDIDGPDLEAEVDRCWYVWEGAARAAIEAMRQPTMAMVHAGEWAQEADWCGGDALGWKQIPVTFTAMIDAALKPQP